MPVLATGRRHPACPPPAKRFRSTLRPDFRARKPPRNPWVIRPIHCETFPTTTTIFHPRGKRIEEIGARKERRPSMSETRVGTSPAPTGSRSQSEGRTPYAVAFLVPTAQNEPRPSGFPETQVGTRRVPTHVADGAWGCPHGATLVLAPLPGVARTGRTETVRCFWKRRWRLRARGMSRTQPGESVGATLVVARLQFGRGCANDRTRLTC